MVIFMWQICFSENKFNTKYMSFQGIRKIREAKRQSPIIFGSQELHDPLPLARQTKLDFQFLLNQANDISTAQKFNSKVIKEQSTTRQKKKSITGKSNSKDKKNMTPLIGNFFHVNISELSKYHNRKFSDAPVIHRTQAGSIKKDDKNGFEKQTKHSIVDYALDFVIGKGGFGKVWKAKEKKTSKIYAIKQMKKVKVIQKKSVQSVMNERNLLSKLKSPFLVNMHCSFQNKQNLFLVMDYCNRGDVRYHIGMRHKFKENQTKFILACIIVCLEYLHKKNIIHRDLKPQNLVLDNQGYVRVTDLGVSRQVRPHNAEDTSGTPGYMAPEVICRMNHSFYVDFFALGVMGYEFMVGKRPYVGQNRKEIREKILAKQVQLPEIPPFGWNRESVDFINRLLQRNPEHRLGYKGIYEIKNHAWFKGFDWQNIEKRRLVSPFIPLTIEEDYTNYKECISEDTEIADMEEYKLILRHPDTQRAFYGYEKHENKANEMRETKITQKFNKKDLQKFFHIQTTRDRIYH